jgi:Flp pilus assembly protein TadD
MIRHLLVLAIAVFGLGIAHAEKSDDATNGDASTDPTKFVPKVAREQAAEGDDAFSKGDYAAAVKAYKGVLELAPNNLVGLVNLGLAEFRAGNPDEAEKALKQAVRLRLETGPAWLTLGMIYLQQNRIEQAFAALSQAVLYDSGNPRAHNYLGVILGRKEWLDGAEAELRRAVEIDPDYRDAHYNLAVIYLQRQPPSVELARRHYYRSRELGCPADPAIEKVLYAPNLTSTPAPSATP